MMIVALIPARIGSKRLKKKNIRLINGKPMISYAINACKRSRLVDRVYVSTESRVIAKIAEEYGAAVIERPRGLAEDDVRTQDVFEHFATVIHDFDILVGIQANSPTIKTDNIDNGIRKLLDNNLWEVRSVNSNGIENGALWILRRDTIFWHGLSVYFGVITVDAIDVHDMADLRKVREILRND
jgi:CMP-N-acetylneuraminic acid synthetase